MTLASTCAWLTLKVQLPTYGRTEFSALFSLWLLCVLVDSGPFSVINLASCAVRDG